MSTDDFPPDWDPRDPIGGNLPAVIPGRLFGSDGRLVDPHELINAQAIVTRLQECALGIRPMSTEEISAAARLLERSMVRAEARPPEKLAPERIEIAADVSDEEALAAYLRVMG